MPRPRVHDPERILDAAEALAVESGPAAVTIRAIGAATGVSNGALYHGFGSRGALLGRAWLRAGCRFLEAQASLIDQALSLAGREAADAMQAKVDAVVAAADTPVVFAERYPNSSALLWTVRREELLDDELPDEIATELKDLDTLLIDVMIRLSLSMWDRKDAGAVDTIAMCIVDLPAGIVLKRDRLRSKTARRQLHAAVKAVLEIGPPPRKGTHHGR
jgi:AcrR family transcriptional regulator